MSGGHTKPPLTVACCSPIPWRTLASPALRPLGPFARSIRGECACEAGAALGGDLGLIRAMADTAGSLSEFAHVSACAAASRLRPRWTQRRCVLRAASQLGGGLPDLFAGPAAGRRHKMAQQLGQMRYLKLAGVLVTGGTDMKVNYWAINKTMPGFSRKASLSGHQSPVESVSLDTEEKVVAAGGADGGITVFDLATEKVTEGLQPAHEGSVTCLAWHPRDPVIVSGSSDTSLKLWDIRAAGKALAPFTGARLTGHSAGITHVSFSPDATAIGWRRG
ncbi:Katanin p80 WD40-containing subunit B1 [Tetrabaena socialis]|uniref:Katanin p80 WD40-containing subunit B1 n=1 Tax=Tetrabaena socialis TaxID=47790 RepID=A0A2J8A6Y0_9CHLO|nr:Katanin p80 WD40-containing subunit B1 [Tetrabaena socialis]|eukprot:PNH08296.1 Katanin p80 WD40-containing subunit B1 [Tetrabaena socialis]